MEAVDLNHHISRSFNGALERLRTRVLAMGGLVEQQVQKALTALAEGDRRLGEAVALEDYKVNDLEVSIDEEYEAIQRQCVASMMENPRAVRRVLDRLWILRSIERIADHARDISEYVIYMVSGRDVRHSSWDDAEWQFPSMGAEPAHAS